MNAYNVTIDGVQLTEVDPAIIIDKIDEAAPSLNPSAVSLGSRFGQLMTDMELRYYEISVSFKLKIRKTNGSDRATVLSKTTKWATAGNIGAGKTAHSSLSVSYRPGKELFVVCAGLHQVGYVREWTEAYKLTFRAYERPYWLSTTATELTTSGTGVQTTTLTNNGNISAPIEFEFKNESESKMQTAQIVLTDSLSLAEKGIYFTGLDLEIGETLVYSHNVQYGIPVAYIYGGTAGFRSVLANRSPQSEDDLMIAPGTTTIRTKSGCNLAWKLKLTERWL